MTTAELRDATYQFDEEFITDKGRPLTPNEQTLWERVNAKGEPPQNGKPQQTISVRLDKSHLQRCTALAKKKRLSRDALIARGLLALLDAEGQ